MEISSFSTFAPQRENQCFLQERFIIGKLYRHVFDPSDTENLSRTFPSCAYNRAGHSVFTRLSSYRFTYTETRELVSLRLNSSTFTDQNIDPDPERRALSLSIADCKSHLSSISKCFQFEYVWNVVPVALRCSVYIDGSIFRNIRFRIAVHILNMSEYFFCLIKSRISFVFS